ncbi:MAG: hypothetical protein K0R93_1582 [Anaerosolibacter sp.]|uniref:DUF2953 domain-containing protein n=1 Tax=Anaerosolibacter sp. TaxID=1872527 RepID=UPI0026039DA4|nr:DUF2953 domain-containing protein [Anaerosolibacter sp.]MDF2546684.1 hypothetical protein [Anaerosolibacter sp.]
MILISILSTLLIFLLILMLTVCLIPFEYAFSGDKHEAYFLEGKIIWIFGGFKGLISMESRQRVSFSLQLFGFHLSPQTPRQEKQKLKKKKDPSIKQEKKKARRFDASLFLNKRLFEVLCRFVADVLKHMKPQAFLLHGSIGFDDPYHTGVFWGGLNILYPLLKNFDIQIVPIFHEEKLEGNFAVQGRIIIGVLILLVIKLLLSNPSRNIIIQFIKNKVAYRQFVFARKP